MTGVVVDEKLVDRIYEAGAVPELWPAVLEDCKARLEEHATHLADLEERRVRDMQRRR